MFAALRLMMEGFKPVIIERGKDVRSRKADNAAISREGKINPDSNYCFGEGGAGTFSDGNFSHVPQRRGISAKSWNNSSCSEPNPTYFSTPTLISEATNCLQS